MSKYISRGLYLVLFTGGLTLLGAGIANAADTTGEDGLLSGSQVVAPISVPVEVAGNAVSLLGDVLAAPAPAPVAPAPAPVAPAPAPVAPAAPTTSGADALLGGTQAVIPVSIPVTVQGNAISLTGDTAATAPAIAPAVPAAPAVPVGTAAAAPTTSGSDGVASGTQLLPTISVPVTLGGNAISLLGDSSSGGAVASVPAAAGGTGSGASTSGSDGIAGGTQVVPDVAIPVTVGGNAISILGDAASTGTTTSPAQEGMSDDVTTTGNNGILGGTQILPSIALPITIGGNAISLIGDTGVGEEDGTSTIDGVPTLPTEPETPILTPVATTTVGAALAAGVRGSGATVAALSVQRLASTGVEIAPVLAGVAALLIAGLGLAFAGRRRTE